MWDLRGPAWLARHQTRTGWRRDNAESEEQEEEAPLKSQPAVSRREIELFQKEERKVIRQITNHDNILMKY